MLTSANAKPIEGLNVTKTQELKLHFGFLITTVSAVFVSMKLSAEMLSECVASDVTPLTIDGIDE